MSLQCDGEKREVTGMEVTHIVGAGIMGNCEGDKKHVGQKWGRKRKKRNMNKRYKLPVSQVASRIAAL